MQRPATSISCSTGPTNAESREAVPGMSRIGVSPPMYLRVTTCLCTEKQVFENLRAILEANGADFTHVVKIQTFLTQLEDLAASREVRDSYLAADPPTSTTVRVTGLVLPAALIEIDVVAVVSGDSA